MERYFCHGGHHRNPRSSNYQMGTLILRMCWSYHSYNGRSIEMCILLIFDIVSDDFDFRLSDVQLEVLDDWQRPNAIHLPLSPHPPQEDPDRKPTMRASAKVDLVQDMTTDCSVVASLCAGTARSERGHQKVC